MKFQYKDKVKIIPLDLPGVIIATFTNEYGMQFKVRYFFNSEPKNQDFFEWELKERE